MYALIPNPVKCKVRGLLSVIKMQKPADILCEVAPAYGNIMLHEKVAKWCRNFTEVQTNVHNKERSRRLLTEMEEFVQKVGKCIREDRHLIVDELHEMF